RSRKAARPGQTSPAVPSAPTTPTERAPQAETKQGGPPAMVADPYGGGKPRMKDLDAGLEQELEAAMGGLSAKDLLGEPDEKGKRTAPSPEQGRKKGRVLTIHGPDVFVEVPGGRGQGVLPMQQFSDGPPALGTEVEINIEGYDAANGLLLLTRRGAAAQADWSSVSPGMTVEARVTETNK